MVALETTIFFFKKSTEVASAKVDMGKGTEILERGVSSCLRSPILYSMKASSYNERWQSLRAVMSRK